MTARLQLELAIGGTLRHYPGPDIGRADADGAIAIEDADGAALEAGVATRGSATGTLAAKAMRASRFITLQAGEAAAFKLRRLYWLKNHEGTGIEVRIVGKVSATDTLQLDQPLPFDADITGAGSTLEDHALEFTTTAATHAAIRRHNVARWSYVVDGEPIIQREAFDIVAAPFDVTITEEDLERADPEFGERRGARGGWAKAMLGARDNLFFDLEELGIYPEQIWGRAMLEKALAHMTLVIFYQRLPEERSRQLELYKRRINGILKAGQWPERQGS